MRKSNSTHFLSFAIRIQSYIKKAEGIQFGSGKEINKGERRGIKRVVGVTYMNKVHDFNV